MNAKRVLVIGILPELVDFSHVPGNMTAEKVRAGISGQVQKLIDDGYAAEHVYIDLGETAEAVLRAKFAERTFDVVAIGAGIRTPPPYFLLFEKVLNVVHHSAPQANICFNTHPGDTGDAVKRWT